MCDGNCFIPRQLLARCHRVLSVISIDTALSKSYLWRSCDRIRITTKGSVCDGYNAKLLDIFNSPGNDERTSFILVDLFKRRSGSGDRGAILLN